jgi:large subunit ribosomal protein L30
MSKLTIRQHKSAIGEKHAAQQTLESLGLRRPGNFVEREDSPTLRGQLRRVAHLVHVEEHAAVTEPAATKVPSAIRETT